MDKKNNVKEFFGFNKTLITLDVDAEVITILKNIIRSVSSNRIKKCSTLKKAYNIEKNNYNELSHLVR